MRCQGRGAGRCEQPPPPGDGETFLLGGPNQSDPRLVSIAEPEISQSLCTDLTVNSVVELTLEHRSLYGIIRWVGTLPERKELMAGIELVEPNLIHLYTRMGFFWT